MTAPPHVLPIVFLDGAFVPASEARIDLFDAGYLQGDGVFETLHVWHGRPLALDLHLDRLEISARFVRLPGPLDRAAIDRAIAGLLERNQASVGPIADLGLRLTLSRRWDGGVRMSIYLRRLAEAHLKKRTLGVLAYPIPWTLGDPSLAQIKTLSRIASALGELVLRERTAHPRAIGVFLGPNAEVVEALTANLFIVEGASVITPPVERGLLSGTSRRVVLDSAAAGAGFEPREERIDVARLQNADEAFITSSTLHVAPVISFDDAPIGTGSPGPAVGAIQDAFARWRDEALAVQRPCRSAADSA